MFDLIPLEQLPKLRDLLDEKVALVRSLEPAVALSMQHAHNEIQKINVTGELTNIQPKPFTILCSMASLPVMAVMRWRSTMIQLLTRWRGLQWSSLDHRAILYFGVSEG